MSYYDEDTVCAASPAWVTKVEAPLGGRVLGACATETPPLGVIRQRLDENATTLRGLVDNLENGLDRLLGYHPKPPQVPGDCITRDTPDGFVPAANDLIDATGHQLDRLQGLMGRLNRAV